LVNNGRQQSRLLSSLPRFETPPRSGLTSCLFSSCLVVVAFALSASLRASHAAAESRCCPVDR